MQWFTEYIWRFKGGKAGTSLVIFVGWLDLHSRVETFIKEVSAFPFAIGLFTSPWFRLALLIIGLGLIYLSTVKAKNTPKPKTIDDRMVDAEAQLSSITDKEKDLNAEKRLAALEIRSDSIAGVVQRIPWFARLVAGTRSLHDEAIRCEEVFTQIGSIYPQSKVYNAPFSRYWTTGASEEDKVACLWRMLMQAHVEHATHLQTDNLIDLKIVGSPELLRYVSEWNTKVVDLSAYEFRVLMGEHREGIQAMLHPHAASFADATHKPTIS